MDERKTALIDALARKAGALLALADTLDKPAADAAAAAASAAATASSSPAATLATVKGLVGRDVGQLGLESVTEVDAALTGALAELRKWVDTASDVTHLMLHAKAEARAGRCVRS